MLTEDYLMRLLNQAVAALIQAIGLRKAGQYREAQEAIDQAVEQLLGLRADLVRRLDDHSLIESLTRQGTAEGPRLELLGDLFKEEGEIFSAQGRSAESFWSTLRALNFYLESALSQEAAVSTELAGKINSLEGVLSTARLPEDSLFALLAYYEQRGDEDSAKKTRSRLILPPHESGSNPV